MEAAFTIIGTVLGFFLSEWAQSRRASRDEARVSAAATSVVAIEIDNNLDYLRRYNSETWASVPEAPSNAQSPVPKADKAKLLLDVSLPPFSRVAFDNQLSLLPRALTSAELKACFRCYEGFSRLETIRETLLSARRDQKHEWEVASGGTNFVPMASAVGMARPFDNRAPALWDEFSGLLARLLEEGNPLAAAASPNRDAA